MIVIASICVTFFYFSPFLLSSIRGYKPELKFVGDLQLAGYPAFIQVGKYLNDWALYGIDFFTANGSSSLFLRPNFTSYYLPQLLIQSVIHASNNNQAALLFTFQMWLNGFLAMLFTTLWLNNILKINMYASLLGGALFFSIIGYIYGQIAFFNVACVFPSLMYCLSIAIKQKTDIYQKVLLSLPIIMIFMAGYLTLAVMGICVAVLAALVFAPHIADDKPKYKDFFIVLVISVLVLSGYMVAIVKAVQIVPTIPKIPFIEPVFFSDGSLTYKGGVVYIFGICS